jgi:hypothetical protein
MVNELDELNLESYTKTVIPATQDENFDKNLKEKYSRFLNIISQDNFKKDVLSQESLEVHTLAAELNGYKEAVESKITTHGYEIVAEFGIYAAKTEVIDASGISYMNISNLTIQDLFDTLLGLSATEPSIPNEPDTPENPDTPDTPS